MRGRGREESEVVKEEIREGGGEGGREGESEVVKEEIREGGREGGRIW